MNKIAILFRGHHYRECTTRGGDNISFNYLNNIENLIKYIIEPLKNEYLVDIYIHTFHSDIENTLQQKIECCKVKIIYTEKSQPYNVIDAISILENVEQYQKIYVLRFDLEFKQKITNFNTNEKGIYFTFHEGDESRVDDLMYIIYSDYLIIFVQGIQQMLVEGNYECLHYLKNHINQNTPLFILLKDKCYGSDTASKSLLSKNPLFKLHSRPYYFDT